MTIHSLQVELPSHLYEQLARRARIRRQSVESELIQTVARALPADDELSPELSQLLASLQLLTADELRNLAESHLAEEVSEKLEALHFKQQRDGLTPSEAEEEAALRRHYERHLLLRAKAIALLTSNGPGGALPRHEP